MDANPFCLWIMVARRSEPVGIIITQHITIWVMVLLLAYTPPPPPPPTSHFAIKLDALGTMPPLDNSHAACFQARQDLRVTMSTTMSNLSVIRIFRWPAVWRLRLRSNELEMVIRGAICHEYSRNTRN
ncbi:hypothetical protein BD410DRAFT_524654 [Rickenella mellea]|uniref:Uncharacterized protein n=1 Tax=Rickenella mellea TaxID=50990 RepID=A0A4Y7QHF3_9AGAM|nr:hypothetical protein BD410DRAFT_524654 [Rickenella mellea]